MIALLLALAHEDDFRYQVDLHTAGRTFTVGRAQFTTTIDPDTASITKTFRYESSDRDVITRQEEVYDKEGRLQSSLTGQTLSGEMEELVELKKEGGKWSLIVGGKKKKDDFPVAITDPSVLWCLSTEPAEGTKIKVQRFDGDAKVMTLTAVFHGPEAEGRKVERWRPGFHEVTWYDDKGRVLRMELTHPPDESTLIYHLAED
jgi:hypothetical protein